MSFLDNLENNLKALESRVERDIEQVRREQAARENERELALKRAPNAVALRNGPFTQNLLTACRTIGHPLRLMVRATWMDTTLRLEARDKKLELRPTPGGVDAVFFEGGVEKRTQAVDMKGDAEALARQWLEN